MVCLKAFQLATLVWFRVCLPVRAWYLASHQELPVWSPDLFPAWYTMSPALIQVAVFFIEHFRPEGALAADLLVLQNIMRGAGIIE